MKPIKVLHITNTNKEEFFFNNLYEYSNSQHIRYCFVTFGSQSRFTESIEEKGLNAYALDAPQRSRYPQAAKKLWNIFKDENPDVINTHLFDPTLISLTLAERQGRKTVVTRHHSDSVYMIPSKIKRKFYLGLENYISRNADHIIAPSRTVHDYLVNRENVPGEKVSIIPYGQTSERFEAITPEVVKKTRLELGMNKQLSLVCVSRLFYGKGHIYLFEALAPLIKHGMALKLYLVGTGDYENKLRQTADELGISENIEFLGWRNDVLSIIASSDIIVHPSLEDALSQSLIESVMLSRPIVATDISGASDILNNGKYGKLVPPADSQSFRQALEETIMTLDEVRERVRDGRDYILDYMNAGRVADDYLKVYRQVLT